MAKISPTTATEAVLPLRPEPRSSTMDNLCAQYDVLAFDAYGVLINAQSALPHAPQLIDRLNSSGKPYFIVTNSSSKTPEGIASALCAFGINVKPERIISSGALIGDLFQQRGLISPVCYAVGSNSSLENITRAGGILLDQNDSTLADVFVIADLTRIPGNELMDRLETLLNRVGQALRAGREPLLVIGNPDPSFPRDASSIGLAPGSVATMIETALEFEFPATASNRFVRLGKPHSPIFDKLLEKAGTRNVVMIGDHIATDIMGASAAGIDSALITDSVESSRAQLRAATVSPTYLLDSLNLKG